MLLHARLFRNSSLEGLAAKQETPFKVGVTTLPTLLRGQKEQQAFPLGGSSLYVLNNEQTKSMIEGVKAFVNFLASEDFQQSLHKKIASVPVGEGVVAKLKEEGFYKENPLHQAVVDQTLLAEIGEASYGIGMPNWAEARNALLETVDRILTKETMTREAIAEELIALEQRFNTKT